MTDRRPMLEYRAPVEPNRGGRPSRFAVGYRVVIVCASIAVAVMIAGMILAFVMSCFHGWLPP